MKNTLGFLKRIFGKAKGDIEIRCLPSRHRLFTRDLEKIRAFIKSHIAEDVFFGVATRKGRNGSKAGTSELRVLWADLDWKDLTGGKAEADKRISEFSLKPSIIVSSGHGYHLYWILKKPLKADLKIEGYLKGIASALGADSGATDIARILRVPGTFNRKNGGEILVTRSNDNGKRYELKDFEQWKIEIPKAAKHLVTFTDTPQEVDVQKFKLSPHIKELILKGWQGDSYESRSEADQAVITGLLKKGASADEILAIFQKHPIGEKYHDKGPYGREYLKVSISSAEDYLAAEEEKNMSRLGKPQTSTNGRQRKISKTKTSEKMDSSKNTEQTPSKKTSSGPINGRSQLRPKVEEGLRTMVCTDYKLMKTRFGLKDYLYWRDEDSDLVLEQYFIHYDVYPLGSKAVRNYMIALGKRSEMLDRVDLGSLIGIRAEVCVETTKPEYKGGKLKGKTMPEILWYSIVTEILKPLG